MEWAERLVLHLTHLGLQNNPELASIWVWPWWFFKYTPLASTISLGDCLKSLLDVKGIQCSFKEVGICGFSELI